MSKNSTLDKLQLGQCATVVGYTGGADYYLSRLMAIGCVPGAEVEIMRVAPLGDTVQVLIMNSFFALRKKEMHTIMVSLNKNE